MESSRTGLPRIEPLPSAPGQAPPGLSAVALRAMLRDWLTRLSYHRRAIAVAFAVPVMLAVPAALVSKPVYVAQAQLLVLYSGAYVYRPTVGQSGDGVALDRNQIILGELQVLQSDLLARETLLDVGLDRVYPGIRAADPAALGRAAERFEKDLTLTSIPQSNILELGFRGHDPVVAAKVLRVLIGKYLERRAAVFDRMPAPAIADDQNILLQRLNRAEDALQAFAATHGIANLDQQITLLLQQQMAARHASADAMQQVEEETAKLSLLESELAQLSPRMTGDTETDRSQLAQFLTDALSRLQLKRRDLASRYQDDFPAVRALNEQIDAVEKQLASTPQREATSVRTGINPVYQDLSLQVLSLKAQLSGARAREEAVQEDADATERRLAALNAASRQYRDLQRARDVLDEGYRLVTRGQDVARANDLAERDGAANVRVIQPPEIPPSGKSLRKIILALGVVAGLFAAAATLAVLHALRSVFVTPDDVAEALRLPVIGIIDDHGMPA